MIEGVLLVIKDRSAKRTGGYDLPGAITVTPGPISIVYAFSEAAESGWGAASTIRLFVVGALVNTAQQVGGSVGVALLSTMVAQVFSNDSGSGSGSAMKIGGRREVESGEPRGLHLGQHPQLRRGVPLGCRLHGPGSGGHRRHDQDESSRTRRRNPERSACRCLTLSAGRPGRAFGTLNRWVSDHTKVRAAS